MDQPIVFVRAPRIGQVKTRLAAEIGPEGALSAYVTLVETLLAAIGSLPTGHLRYAPDDAESEIRPWLPSGWRALPQGPGDLGDRMDRAFVEAFAAGARRVTLIGSDCPDITVGDIEAAWQALDANDLVLGPATDGGYWLIGLRAPRACLFRDMPWSTSNVLQETIVRAKREGLRTFLLRELADVDTRQDWERFVQSKMRDSGCSNRNSRNESRRFAAKFKSNI